MEASYLLGPWAKRKTQDWLLLLRFSFISFHWHVCRVWRFLAVPRSFFHSALLCTFSCHLSPPTILPSSLTSSCRLFLGLPLGCHDSP
jgi:hypothetical protein